MFSSKGTISIRQLQLLIMLNIFGTGVIYLPRAAVIEGGASGWISVVAAVVMAGACAFLVLTLALSFPGQSFAGYASAITIPAVGRGLSLCLALYAALASALELRVFTEIMETYMLAYTPQWITAGVTLLLGVYAAASGYHVRGRIGEILAVVVFVPLVALLAVVSAKVDYTNLLPMFDMGLGGTLKGSLSCGFAFMWIPLLLAAPRYLEPGGLRRGRGRLMGAALTAGGLAAVVTLLAIARFGPQGVARRAWPVLEMLNTVQAAGAFLERKDALVMGFWIITSFVSVSGGLFFSSALTRDALGREGRGLSGYMGVFALAVLGLSRLPAGAEAAIGWLRGLYTVGGAAFMLVIPGGLLIISRIRGVRSNV